MARDTDKGAKGKPSKSNASERSPLDRAALAGLHAGKLLLKQKRAKKQSVYGLSDGKIYVFKSSTLKTFEDGIDRKIVRKPSVTLATLRIDASGKVSKRSASRVAKKLVLKK